MNKCMGKVWGAGLVVLLGGEAEAEVAVVVAVVVTIW